MSEQNPPRDLEREATAAEVEGIIPPPRPAPSVWPGMERRLELREEELVPRKERRELGEVVIRTEVEEVPGRLELEAYREELEIEHVPVGETVRERREPWDEDGVLIIPVYEEQLVVSKRLVLREYLRIRRNAVTETYLFEDRLRRDKLVIDDPLATDAVRELAPSDEEAAGSSPEQEESSGEGLVERMMRKVIS